MFEGRALLEAVLPSTPGPLVLAVSGGADSLSLLALAAENRRHFAARGQGFLVITIDHGLRCESASEAEYVANVSRRSGLSHRTLRWSGPPGVGNLSAQARAGRYALLVQAARESGANAVLTAHHQDDQIETHLMAAERGEGFGRQAGMRSCRALAPGIVLARPFLDIPKGRLVASLRLRGIGWVEDPTNIDPRFQRARLRAGVDAWAPECRAAALARIAACAAERDTLEQRLSRVLTKVCATRDGVVTLPRANFEGPTATPSAILSRMLRAVGGSANPAAGPRIAALSNRLGGTGEPFAATLGGCLVRVGRERVEFLREYGRDGPPPVDLATGAGGMSFDERFDLARAPLGAVRLVPLGATGRGGLRERTLPVALDEGGRVVAAHPDALRRLPPDVKPVLLAERVTWRLHADLPTISQIAAKALAPVGKDFPADYLPMQRTKHLKAGGAMQPAQTDSQDE